ncbi:uncharacterized protein JCM6883_003357 [Sporobolomyces salmoneus]|uniref:uncharacterized protein n=1 Tax=Sporobolomyces salmoneus TaxID=183962 RepID=UPI00316B2920
MASYPLPIIDLDAFLASPTSPEGAKAAKLTAQSLIEYGALIVKDTRVSEEANSRFLDLMEDYFDQPQEALEKDLRPEVHYQVGATLENTEKPKCHSHAACQAIIASLDPQERPLDLAGGKADPKCRFFHRMGKTPPSTAFPSLGMTNLVPEAFPNWIEQMEEWGNQIKTAVEGVTEALSVGLGLERDTLTKAAEFGSHLLAPTATDLKKYGKEGEIFAGFHTDLNFLTIHGRSRYPGLNIWARNSGKRLEVKLPPGCLLVQAGKQLEHLTAGLILAGYHEVICSSATMAALERRRSDPSTSSRPEIRISSTFFYHLSNDYSLRPKDFIENVKGSEVVRELKAAKKDAEWEKNVRDGKYEEGLLVGDLIQNELKEIALHA